MVAEYVIGIDQSTQGTKLLLFDREGKVAYRSARPHGQHVDDRGWVEHDPEEIWDNVKTLVRDAVSAKNLTGAEIAAIGISNQRETALAWDRETGRSIYPAIVWQCARGTAIVEELRGRDFSDLVEQRTGLPLSPYFSAAKLAWIMRHVSEAGELAAKGRLAMGTVDSWLVFKMTGESHQTDYSNASRTQLFDIRRLCWDEEICRAFGIPLGALPSPVGSDSFFGETDFEGILGEKVPIRGAMGDSHAALFGQGCHEAGLAKATYGTGSSIMLNTGEQRKENLRGLAATIAWGRQGKVVYALEGNINYTGAAITWLKDDLELIGDAAETADLAAAAHPADKSYFVPAFTGLGAPYWDDEASGVWVGITRVTGKKEMVRAVLDSVAYQIGDVLRLMEENTRQKLKRLQVDGGPTRNPYLMQFQSDVLGTTVAVSSVAELSATGAAYAAGIAAGFYDEKEVFKALSWQEYEPRMTEEKRGELLDGWQRAVDKARSK